MLSHPQPWGWHALALDRAGGACALLVAEAGAPARAHTPAGRVQGEVALRGRVTQRVFDHPGLALHHYVGAARQVGAVAQQAEHKVSAVVGDGEPAAAGAGGGVKGVRGFMKGCGALPGV